MHTDTDTDTCAAAMLAADRAATDASFRRVREAYAAGRDTLLDTYPAGPDGMPVIMAADRAACVAAMAALYPLAGDGPGRRTLAGAWDALFAVRPRHGRYPMLRTWAARKGVDAETAALAEYLHGRIGLHAGRRGHGMFASVFDHYKPCPGDETTREDLDTIALHYCGGSKPGAAWARALRGA